MGLDDPQADSWQQASGEHPARPVCVWSRRHSYGWQDLLYMTGGYNRAVQLSLRVRSTGQRMDTASKREQRSV